MRISPACVDKLSEWAQEYYDAALPFHNWSHAVEVMEQSLALVNRGGRRTRHINRALLQVAAAWHDDIQMAMQCNAVRLLGEETPAQ